MWEIDSHCNKIKAQRENADGIQKSKISRIQRESNEYLITIIKILKTGKAPGQGTQKKIYAAISHDASVENFSGRINPQLFDNKPYMNNVSALETTLESTDPYELDHWLNINYHVNYEQRQSACKLMRLIHKIGDFNTFYFRLPPK